MDEQRSKRTYDMALMHHMALFEQLTRVSCKDCFIDEARNSLVFVVEPGAAGRAVGKGAINVRRLEERLKKKVRIVEFANTPEGMIRSLIKPLEVEKIERDEGKFILHGKDEQTNGRIIGRSAQNLRQLEQQVRRYYPVEEIRVV